MPEPDNIVLHQINTLRREFREALTMKRRSSQEKSMTETAPPATAPMPITGPLAPTPIPATTPFTITLQAQEWNGVLEALGNGRYNTVAPLIQQIGEQLQQQATNFGVKPNGAAGTA